MSHTRPEKHLDPSYCIWFFTKNLQPRPFGLEMMLSPPISRCRYFSYLFLRGTIIQYHPLSSINPSHKSQRFWWYHPIAIGSHLQAPARPQHGPRCGLCRGGWRASWSAEGMRFSWWWLGRNPNLWVLSTCLHHFVQYLLVLIVSSLYETIGRWRSITASYFDWSRA